MAQQTLKILAIIGLLLTLFCGCTYWYVVATSPDVVPIKGCMITSMNGVNLCSEDPSYVALSEISHKLRDAVVYSEDAKFFDHNGFDFYEIRASFKSNLKRLKFHRGASSLTQQLVKNVFLNRKKTILRKLREAYLTVKVEELLSKDEILEKYLNVVQFGPQLSGIRAAANFYFQKSPIELDLLESSYLAHLLPSPMVYSKGFRNKKLTEFSRKQVLAICRRLYDFKKITKFELKAANEQIQNFPWDLSASPPSDATLFSFSASQAENSKPEQKSNNNEEAANQRADAANK